ncbi:hypothetical protein HDU99_008454, partial [Rhizoclosmatium hyalinum]
WQPNSSCPPHPLRQQRIQSSRFLNTLRPSPLTRNPSSLLNQTEAGSQRHCSRSELKPVESNGFLHMKEKQRICGTTSFCGSHSILL